MSELGLTLDGRHYSKAALLSRCAEKLADANSADWEIQLYAFIQTWLDASETLAVKTSGTTGAAKTLHLSKHAMRHSARMTGLYFNLRSSQTALLCLPASHIAGQMMVVRAFELGLDLLTTAPNAIQLTAESIDFAAMAPAQVYKLLFLENKEALLERIKTLLLGGADISPKLLNALQTLDTEVYQSYAMTETVSHIALRRINPAPQQACYTALPGVSLNQDERGCLILSAPGLGVRNLSTNDVIALHSTTEFEWLGRNDNVINSGGIKFNPEQIEAKLNDVLPERRFFIAGEADEKLGQRLILLIEGEPLPEAALAQLQTRLESRATRYERPKAIYFLPVFLETETGKIQRQATAESLAGRKDSFVNG